MALPSTGNSFHQNGELLFGLTNHNLEISNEIMCAARPSAWLSACSLKASNCDSLLVYWSVWTFHKVSHHYSPVSTSPCL